MAGKLRYLAGATLDVVQARALEIRVCRRFDTSMITVMKILASFGKPASLGCAGGSLSAILGSSRFPYSARLHIIFRQSELFRT